MVKSYKIGDISAPAFGSNYSIIDQVVLNMTDIQGNNNKFYSMELQQCNRDYRIYTHYGRVGDGGVKEGRYVRQSDVKPNKGQTIEEAIRQAVEKEFEKIKKSKTRKGYHIVDVESADVGSRKIKSHTRARNSNGQKKESCSLDDRVISLVEQIYDEASVSLTNSIRTPLGALSESQIDKGYEKLGQIRKAIKCRDSRLITKLTSEFYSLIPQRFSHRINPQEVIIDTDDKADRKEELLQLMRDVYNVKDDLESSVMAKYMAVNTSIEPIDSASREYKMLEKKVRKTQSPHHNIDLLINNIYRIELQSTKNRFNPRKLKTMDLFHGSANKNILGILQRGLLISPPCAQFTGAAFGRGIYFARHSTKSSQYSTKFYGNMHQNGFLFVADVAVGKMQKARFYTFNDNGPSHGYNSVMGVAGADLIHDEYIVYNVNQVELKYLIDFTPKSKRW